VGVNRGWSGGFFLFLGGLFFFSLFFFVGVGVSGGSSLEAGGFFVGGGDGYPRKISTRRTGAALLHAIRRRGLVRGLA